MRELEPRTPSGKEKKEAERYGGSDTDDYVRRDNVGYADKGGHRERSEYWSEEHREHWQKEEKNR